jgi:hypothetical protein
MTTLADKLLPDGLWQRIERLQELLLDELGEAGGLD